MWLLTLTKSRLVQSENSGGNRTAYVNDKTRAKILWNNFRITPADWDKMFQFQRGMCAICGEPQPISKKTRKTKRLATDHNHTTGEVRGLLCSRCNPVLGKIENAFVRFGLNKVEALTLLVFIARLLNYVSNPPARAALGKVTIGYPGRVGTKAHRDWIRAATGLPPVKRKRKKTNDVS